MGLFHLRLAEESCCDQHIKPACPRAEVQYDATPVLGRWMLAETFWAHILLQAPAALVLFKPGIINENRSPERPSLAAAHEHLPKKMTVQAAAAVIILRPAEQLHDLQSASNEIRGHIGGRCDLHPSLGADRCGCGQDASGGGGGFGDERRHEPFN
jgi:hypothetical protein